VKGLWNGFLINGESGEGTRGRRDPVREDGFVVALDAKR
jgi:hypothetical protein